MTQSRHTAILRRKLRTCSGPRGRNGAEAAIRRLIPRIAEEDFGVEVRLAALDQNQAGVSQALGGGGDTPLILGFGAPGRPPLAVAIADAGFVAAIVEIETTRAVTTIRREPRVPTPVDVALVGRVITRWIAAMRDVADPDFLPDADLLRHFVDRRAVLVALDDGPARVLDFDFDFGDGRRRGGLRLLVPLAPSGTGRVDKASSVAEQVGGIGVPLRAVLSRQGIALARLRGLVPGDLLELDGASLRRIALEAQGGMRIATAHLGQSGGRRALRLTGRGEEPAADVSERSADLEAMPAPQGAASGTIPAIEPDLPAVPDEAQEVAAALPTRPGDTLPPIEGDLPPLPADLMPEQSPVPLPAPLPPL